MSLCRVDSDAGGGDRQSRTAVKSRDDVALQLTDAEVRVRLAENGALALAVRRDNGPPHPKDTLRHLAVLEIMRRIYAGN